MSYGNTVVNAYPNVNLHDAKITGIRCDEKGLLVFFPEGFILGAETHSDGCSEILAKGVAPSDVEIVTTKSVRLFKGMLPIYISKYTSIKGVRKLLKKHCFTIIDEFYRLEQVIWRGVIEKEEKRQAILKLCLLRPNLSTNIIDRDWEHGFGITIETLDNPRWCVKI